MTPSPRAPCGALAGAAALKSQKRGTSMEHPPLRQHPVVGEGIAAPIW